MMAETFISKYIRLKQAKPAPRRLPQRQKPLLRNDIVFGECKQSTLSRVILSREAAKNLSFCLTLVKLPENETLASLRVTHSICIQALGRGYHNFNVVPQNPHLNIPSAFTGMGAPQRGQIISIGLLTCFTLASSCLARILFWKSPKYPHERATSPMA
jgi:hypothetical protein